MTLAVLRALSKPISDRLVKEAAVRPKLRRFLLTLGHANQRYGGLPEKAVHAARYLTAAAGAALILGIWRPEASEEEMPTQEMEMRRQRNEMLIQELEATRRGHEELSRRVEELSRQVERLDRSCELLLFFLLAPTILWIYLF